MEETKTISPVDPWTLQSIQLPDEEGEKKESIKANMSPVTQHVHQINHPHHSIQHEYEYEVALGYWRSPGTVDTSHFCLVGPF